MKEDFEKKIESQEQPTSKVVLEFFRHGEKDGDNSLETRLTALGRSQAIEKGKKIKPQPEVALAIGSPRKRTQETAVRVILAEKEEIIPEMSLEEIEKFISSEQKYGKKIVSDPRLDFIFTGQLGVKAIKIFREDKKLMHYLANESDQDALKFKDFESTTYSRGAGNVAELIWKYIKIAPMFDKIVQKNPEKYARHKNQMERYIGSHLSALEPFLIKIVEKNQGIESRNKFVELLEPGLADTEGFRVEISNAPSGIGLKIKYKFGDQEESVEISPEIIEEIIKEKNELNRKIEEK